MLAGCLTWGVTALGAALVFPFRALSRALLDAMFGRAAGVMIAASVWSLLLPAIELAAAFGGGPAWAPASVGVVLGCPYGNRSSSPVSGPDDAGSHHR